MLSRIHDVPVDMRSSHEVEAEEDTFNTVRRALFSNGDYAVVCSLNFSVVWRICLFKNSSYFNSKWAAE